MKMLLTFPTLLAPLVLAGCFGMLRPPVEAQANVAATQGNRAEGVVRFTEVDGGVLLDAQVTGLTPGQHGFHVHEKGDCSAPDGTSAGGHFNPTGKPHGKPDGMARHLGDLPMLVAGADGSAKLKVVVEGLTLTGKGPGNVTGKAVVIHADADDYKSQPAGNSGARVACGVIMGK